MRKLIGVLAFVLVAGATACSRAEGPSTSVAESIRAPESNAAGVEAFCAEYLSLQGERPESYVGSSEHVADADGLLAVAPEAIAGQAATLRDYLESGAIDSEADPESNLVENWPDDIQTAIANLETFVAENC